MKVQEFGGNVHVGPVGQLETNHAREVFRIFEEIGLELVRSALK